MKYDFDKITDRKGTGSVKWERAADMLPMWVADMDFETYPGIKEAIVKRASHGIYGYTCDCEEWFDAYIGWWKNRHSFKIEKDWLVFVTGVIPAISSAVRKLTTPGEKVLIQTPVYPIFFNSILNNGRIALENPLTYSPDTRSYSIDWADLEEKLKDPQTTLMILCNPQNPSGNIWDKETLARIGELCHENHVRVISDEIHCDLTKPGCEYVPFASVSEINRQISVTCIAPTKTFNIAGIQTAAIVVPDPDLRHKMWRGINTDEVGEGNCFTIEAVRAAYTEGGAEWLDELRAYISGNREYAEKYIGEKIPSLKTIPSSSTYLMWVDCSAVTDDSDAFVSHLEKDQKLMLNSGSGFGGNGNCFVRINLACPRSLLEDGMKRLEQGCRSFESLS